MTSLIFLVTILVLIFIGITISGCARILYTKSLKENLDKVSSNGKTASEIAKAEIKKRGMNTQVVRVPGKNNAFFDYKNNVVALSDNIYSNFSAVAGAIAMHEVGHAIQNSTNSKKFSVFKKFNFVSRILLPLFWIGMLCSLIFYFTFSDEKIYFFVSLGISLSLLFLDFLFKVLTVSMEKEASKIGFEILKNSGTSQDELKEVKSIYAIALTTYFANIFKPVVDLFNGITWIIFNTIGKLFR